MITVENLEYTYPRSNKPAICSLSFNIHQGEIFGFLGPSGAGKSTTQKILIGLLSGYKGSVKVMNKEVSQWGSDFYENIGVAFEQPNHFLKLSALENLTYFAALYRQATFSPLAILEQVGLKDDAAMPVSQYSKGMKTRLNVARALINDPLLIFMDEPTTGLDPVNARQIKDLIQEQKSTGKTIFLTTHNMTVADELCDHVAFLVDGKICLIDTPRTLKLRYGKAVVRVEHRQDGRVSQSDFNLDTLAENEAFYQLLRSGTIQTIHTQEATLEDIFIQATGRSLL